jgi:hypothetical protein
MEEMRQQVMPEGEVPEAPNYVDLWEQGREEQGLEALEHDLVELKRMEREQQAIRRERIEGTYQERTRMSAIQGQVSEIERQESERIDTLNREIAYKADSVNSAYAVINNLINLTRMGWQDAYQVYNDKIKNNMAMYQQLRGEYESDRTFAQQQLEYQQDFAKSNLQVYTDLIAEGQLTWDQMDATTKTEIRKLEVQSGLGLGFLSKIKISPDKQVQSITDRVEGGFKYADILKFDPVSGQMIVETIKLGKVTMPSTGSSRETAQAKLYKEAEDMLSNIEANLQMSIYREGSENEQMADKLMADWEINRAIKAFKSQYGEEEGMELFDHAWNTGGYQEYKK